MQQGGDQHEELHFSGLKPTFTCHTWRTTEASAIVSALAHVLSADKLLQLSPSDLLMTVDSTSLYSSPSTSDSWTAQKGGSQEQELEGFSFLDLVPTSCDGVYDFRIFSPLPPSTPPSSPAEDVPRNLGTSGTIQDRIKSAIHHLQICYQFWAPVLDGGQIILTTLHQPFWYDYFSEKLHKYREKSSAHNYGTNIGKEDQLGPPGRVFLRGLPEFSPNVKYYSTKEYYLRDYALLYGLKEYCALPVFESLGGEHCVGVLELLPSSMEYGIRKTIEQVFTALQAVGLTSSGMFFHMCSKIYTNQFATKRLLNALCKMHKFPIARAWVPSTHPDSGTRGGHQKIRVPNSICEVTRLCVYEDDNNWEDAEEVQSFRSTCASLQEWQGLVGKAFSSGKSCFCTDITQFSMIDYPFLHYARDCKLTSCFAIFLRGMDPRFEMFILELFLAPGGMHNEDPQALLRSLLVTMAEYVQNFKIAAGQEEQRKMLLLEVSSFSSDNNVDYFQISQSWGIVNDFEALENGRTQEHIHSSSYNRGEEREVRVTNSNNEGGIELEGAQGDVEARISYELVKQQFGKKLADAAASLEVSRSTLKRRCRKLGIRRWPSHRRTRVDSLDEERTEDYPAVLPRSNVVPGEATNAMSTGMQDKNTMIVKATHGDHIIKFSLSLSSGIEDLRHEVAKRLEGERYIMQYKDEDGDWILLACNDDLHDCMQSQKVLGKISIRLLPVDNSTSNSQSELKVDQIFMPT